MIKKSLTALGLTLSLTACTFPETPLQSEQIAPATTQYEKVAVIFSLPQVTAEPTLRTQMVDTNALKYISLSLVGENQSTLQGPLVPYNGGNLTLSLDGILQQVGQYRMVTIQGYDQNKQALSAFVAKAWYRSQQNVVDYALEVNRRQLVTVKVMEALLNQSPASLDTLDPVQLQNLVDTALGYNANTGSFSQDPLSLQIEPLVQQIMQGSALQANDVQNATAAINGNVQVKLAMTDDQALISEPLTLTIAAPKTPAVQVPKGNTQSVTYAFNVVPGTYAIAVKNSQGTLVGSGSITVQNNGSVTSQPVVPIIDTQPIITSINRQSGLQDDVVIISGTHLDRITQASFNGTPQTQFETQSNGSLSFKVPAGISSGPLNLTWGDQYTLQASDYFTSGRILYVKSGSSGSGISFDDAYGSVADALAAAPANSEIWITEGAYTPAATLQLASQTVVRGGFSASNPENDPNQRDWNNHVTTLSGNNNKLIMLSANQVTLEGLTLSQGVTNDDYSGGALTISSGHTVNIQDCVFQNNINVRSTTIGSGAIYTKGITNILRSTFTQNEATGRSGGAISVEGSGTLTLTDSTLSQNKAKQVGGGILLGGSGQHNIVNTVFYQNQASQEGGGIYYLAPVGSSLNINQVTFDSNQSSTSGGGIYTISGFNSTTINKTIFVANQAGYSGGAVYIKNGPVTLQQSMFSGNAVTDTSGNGKGGAIYMGEVIPTNVTVNNSLLIGNANLDYASGIYIDKGNLNLNHTSLIKHFSAYQPNTAGIHNVSGTVTAKNTLFWRSAQNIGIGNSVDANGNIAMDLPSTSPFMRELEAYTLPNLVGPDGIPFTNDDPYVLNPANAAMLIDKGYSSSLNTDIQGQNRPADYPGIGRGSNDSDADIGAYEVTP